MRYITKPNQKYYRNGVLQKWVPVNILLDFTESNSESLIKLESENISSEICLNDRGGMPKGWGYGAYNIIHLCHELS